MPAILLGAYGKLPRSREFVRAGPRVPDLEAAVDQAARFWMRPGRDPALADTWLTLTEASHARVTSIWPSADAGNERAHPFATFALVPDVTTMVAAVEVTPALIPALAAVRDAVAAGLEPTLAVTANEASLFVDLPPIEPWADAAFANGVDSLVLALWQLHVLGRTTQAPSALRLPLSPRSAALAQARAWLAFIPPTHRSALRHVVLPAVDASAPSLLALTAFDPRDLADLLTRGGPRTLDLTADAEPAIVDGFSAFARACERRIADADHLGSLIDPAELRA